MMIECSKLTLYDCHIFLEYYRCRELKLVERCLQLPSRVATKAEILKLHSPEHYECLERTAGVNDEESMEELSSHYDAIYIHPVRRQVARKNSHYN